MKPTMAWLMQAVIWALMALSLGLMVYASWLMRPDRFAAGQDGFVQAMGWVVIGWLVLGVAFALAQRQRYAARYLHGAWRDARPPEGRVPPIRWRWLVAGAVPVMLVIQVNIIDLWRTDLDVFWRSLGTMPAYGQSVLLVMGWSIMLWALMGQGRRFDWRWRWRRAHTLLAMIVVLGFVLRAWNLELWITRFLDEMHYMNAVARIWENDRVQILMPFSEVTAFSWAYALLQSLTAGFFGTTFTGVRFISVIMGTAQIIAVYWLGRSILPRRTALLAALVLATFPPHIHFSKIGINNIADPLFGMMALGYLARGLRGGRMAHFIMAGAMLGFTHYFYEGGRLFYSAFVALWLLWLLFLGRRDDSALRYLDGRMLQRMGAAWLIIVLPMYYVWVVQGVSLTPRFELMGDLRQQSALTDATLPFGTRLVAFTDKLPLPVRGLVQMADTSWFYSGEQALVLWFLAPLLLVGAGHVLWRTRTVGGSLLFWWLAGVLVANSFISDSVASPRYIIVMGALSLLIAIGMTHTTSLLLTPFRRTGMRRFLLRLSVAGAGLLISVIHIGYYYGVHLPAYYEGTFYDFFDHRTGQRFLDTNDALLRAITLPPYTDVHIVSRNLVWSFDMDSITRYHQRHDMRIRHVFPDVLDEAYLHGLSTFRNQAFFLEPDDGASFVLINNLLPFDMARSGLASPYPIPKDSQLYLYFSPASYIVRDDATWE